MFRRVLRYFRQRYHGKPLSTVSDSYVFKIADNWEVLIYCFQTPTRIRKSRTTERTVTLRLTSLTASVVTVHDMQDRKDDDNATASEKPRKKKRRSAPLTGVSKLRKAANARERERVRVLNEGIELLKSILPMDASIVKPTKTDIIWMAASYICELREMLHETDSGRSSGSEEFEELSPASVGTAQECISDLSDLESLMSIDIDELVTFEKEHQISFCADTYAV